MIEKLFRLIPTSTKQFLYRKILDFVNPINDKISEQNKKIDILTELNQKLDTKLNLLSNLDQKLNEKLNEKFEMVNKQICFSGEEISTKIFLLENGIEQIRSNQGHLLLKYEEPLNLIEKAIKQLISHTEELTGNVPIWLENRIRSINFQNYLEGMLSLDGLKVPHTKKSEWYQALNRSLSQQDEFNLFNEVSIEQIVEFANESTSLSVVGHWSHLLKPALEEKGVLNSSYIKPITASLSGSCLQLKDGIMMYHPSAIPAAVGYVKDLLITNIHYANLLLLTPDMLDELSSQIKSTLILPFNIPSRPFTVVWEKGFSSPELDEGIHYRWIVGEEKVARLSLINNKDESIPVRISWESITLYDGDSNIEILTSNNQKFKFPLSQKYVKNQIDLVLESGITKFDFTYSGQTIKYGDDPRAFNFTIKDMKISSSDPYIELMGEECFSLENFDYYGLNDSEIRMKLHSSGFFEVTSYQFYNNGLLNRPLLTTRYLFIDQYYEYSNHGDESALTNEINFPTTVYYIAKKYGVLKEDIDVE